jgi:DNA-binding NtrC family response regulator
MAATSPHPQDTVLLVESEVLVRTTLAAYLRKCGYAVVETVSAAEALQVLKTFLDLVHIVLSDVKHGFVLSQWAREHRPELDVIITGTVQKAAQVAAELCDDGPQQVRPHDPQRLADEIKRALALRH